jgi:DNA replication protein DnaC
MIPPEDIAAWREAFLAEAGIDPAIFSEDVLASQDEPGQGPTTEDRIPARYADALATDPQIRAWMAAIVRQAITDLRVFLTVTSGPSLLLLGPTGTGKTHEGYGAMRGLASLGIRVNWRAITAADFYARLRPRHGVDSETEFREFAGARLLVLDDLGAGKPSDWTEEVNFRLINHRYEHALPTLFSSNLPPLDHDGRPGLRTVLGDRVWSRLAEMTTKATLKGGDRRFSQNGGQAA